MFLDGFFFSWTMSIFHFSFLVSLFSFFIPLGSSRFIWIGLVVFCKKNRLSSSYELFPDLYIQCCPCKCLVDYSHDPWTPSSLACLTPYRLCSRVVFDFTRPVEIPVASFPRG
jgi:hypothetical protein